MPQVTRAFNASRLRLARKRRGLTKVTLAKKAALTTKRVYELESGKAQPSADELESIAFVLRFPGTFFFRADLFEPSSETASFRSLKSMTAGARDAALAAGALAFEISEWIDQRFEVPPPSLPDLRDFEPEAAAIALRSRWAIGERPIGNLVNLLEAHGVRVFSLAEQGRHVDAFSLWYRDVPFVFLNTMKTSEHSRMDAAHELGHLVLHQHGAPQGRDLEKDAQAFGAAFLMPRGSVFATVPRMVAPRMTQLVQLKRNWKVSVAALAHRLHAMDLLSEWHYRNVCIEVARFGRTREPESIPRETSQVLFKVFGSLRETGMTKADVARQLDLYTEDVDALIFGLGIVPAAEGQSVPDASAEEKRRGFRVV